jgi:hypothetical protein
VIEEEPDRSRGSSAAVDTDAAPPPTPGLRRLHRPAVSTVAFPLFSLRQSCFLLCLWACRRAAIAWARRAAVSPWTTPRRALQVKSRGMDTPSRAHRVNQSGRELGLPCWGRREHVPAPRRRARVPSARRVSGFLFWPRRRSGVGQGDHGGGAGAPQRREPGRVQPPCQELAREPVRPGCRGSRRRRAISGRAAAVDRVLCCEPAFEPRTCVAGAGERESRPAAPTRAMATASPPAGDDTQARRAASRAWRLPRAFRRPPGGRRAVLGCEGAAGRRPELGSKPS